MSKNDTIELVAGLDEVPVTMGYHQRAYAMLEYAKRERIGSRSPGYNDDKLLVTNAGLESLIGAGGKVICLNDPETDAVRSTVEYREHTFFTISSRPQALEVKSRLRF